MSVEDPKDEEHLLEALGQSKRAETKPSGPSAWVVHGALILTQVIFGGGAVVGKLGVSSFNPVLFALIREGVAGPILCALAWYRDRVCPRLGDLWLFALAGSCLFSNQLGFIVGEKLASAVIGSAWQPTQPIFSASIAILLGWEQASALKFGGILMALLGAAFMVTTSPDSFAKFEVDSGNSAFAGNVLFFFNCLGTALYVICAKKLLAKGYPSTTVTGYSYILASVQMTVVALCINTQSSAVHFVCPLKSCGGSCGDCRETDMCYDNAQPCGSEFCSCSAWGIPSNAVLPLAYWIAFNSVVAYLLMTWATQHAPPSAVLGYTALQPLTSSILVLIITAFTSKYDLTKPGYNMVGAVLILVGLYMLIGSHLRDEAKGRQAPKIDPEQEESSPLDPQRNGV
eukprot:TRINITY_DN8751_c0_g1_i1.p1 TRINITY_DN8751_c0_g1~~TRINITY_DN8751_c0_g1_i1.p1  ORF type:complete len:400 (+),score=81.56 TRINITY_DN8751_c0_g1_i1:41-1240(+)